MRPDSTTFDRRNARRFTWQTALILASLWVAAPAQAAVLTRGPYLQLLTTHSVTIVWNTDVAGACSLTVGALGGAPATIAGGTGQVCAIPLAGLTPGAQYTYVPNADGVPLRSESVFQADDPNRPVAFVVIGDSGSAGPKQYALRDRMLASRLDVMLHTGDMIYVAGLAPDFNPKFFTPYRDIIRTRMFWPTLGNHDFRTAAGQPWRDAFYTPANNAAGSENYYSFDVGHAHVAVIDSDENTSPGSPQYQFLDQDLGASTALWKFVAFHHTIYSSGRHTSDKLRQKNLAPLFDRHAVDVVFMGHDHDYERTKPLRANHVVAPGLGTVYITTGGGGEDINPVGTSTFTAYSEAAFHFTRVVVDGGSLLEQMIRDDGAVRDTMTILKSGAPPTPRCGDGLVNQPSEQCDGIDHPACVAGCAPDCTCLPSCGDGRVNRPAEACDGRDDTSCPGLCLSDCQCGAPSRIVTLAPIADTYVEAGADATWDHGIADHLHSDLKPFGVAYLKFDLSAVRVPIAHATLTLFCTNNAPDGGTAYAVADSTWIEGTRTGANKANAAGPGLKWIDIDTNRDGNLDATDTSPYGPDLSRWLGSFGVVTAGHWYSVDVTGAFQTGPGVHTLAIKNNSADGASYASRESVNPAQRPVLRLELAN